ncbi:MAG: PhoH family protein, partial [Halioglobus sp.]|nr:PhoH family protein [Halioglobus sp.]
MQTARRGRQDTLNSEPPPETPTTASTRRTLTLEPNDARHLAILCGHLDCHLRQIEQRLGIRVSARGNQFLLEGPAASIDTAERLLTHLYAEVCQGVGLSPESLHLQLQQAGLENLAETHADAPVEALQIIRTKRTSVKPRGRNQQAYVRSIKHHDINFGIGPAGTGKT